MMAARSSIEARAVASALADPASRRVMAQCVSRPRSAKDISERARVPLTTVYRVIHRLERQGVLFLEKSAMTRDGRKYDLYRSRVRAAGLELDEAGERVRWVPNAIAEPGPAAWGLESRA